MLKQLKDEETGALHSGHDSNNTEIPVEADQSRPFRGLTSAEAADRFKRFGPNRLPTRRPAPNLEANNFPNGTFRVAGGLAILAGMPHLGLAIFVVILLNGIFAFAQEHRAERASEKLRELLTRRVLVIRDGIPSEISADDLVPGDLVCLRVGGPHLCGYETSRSPRSGNRRFCADGRKCSCRTNRRRERVRRHSGT